MNGQVYQWVYSLLICGGATSIVLFLCPENRCKGLIETGCTCVMFIVLLTPIFHIDFDDYMNAFADYCHEINEEQLQFDLLQAEFHKKLIEQEFAEYILNEAELNGVSIDSVIVITTETDEGSFLPFEIVYQSDSQIPYSFIIHIESILGVTAERQRVNEFTRDNSNAIEK